jgi:hypothetical protein
MRHGEVGLALPIAFTGIGLPEGEEQQEVEENYFPYYSS